MIWFGTQLESFIRNGYLQTEVAIAMARIADSSIAEFKESIAIELADDESYDEKEEIQTYFTMKAWTYCKARELEKSQEGIYHSRTMSYRNEIQLMDLRMEVRVLGSLILVRIRNSCRRADWRNLESYL